MVTKFKFTYLIDKFLLVSLNQLTGLHPPLSQTLLDHAKQSATDAFKTALRRAIKKTVEGTGDLTGNKIADKITKIFKISPQSI